MLSEAKHLCLLRCAGSVGNHQRFFASLRMTFMRERLNRSLSPAEFAHRRYGAFTQCAVKTHFRFQPQPTQTMLATVP